MVVGSFCLTAVVVVVEDMVVLSPSPMTWETWVAPLI